MSRFYEGSPSPPEPPRLGGPPPPARLVADDHVALRSEDQCIDHARNQSEPRSSRLMRVRMVHPKLGPIEVNIRNISTHGMGGITEAPLSIGDRVELCLKNGQSINAEIRWTRPDRKRTAFGLRSDAPLDPASFATKADGQSWDHTVIKPLDENHVFTRYRPVVTSKRPGFRRV